MSDMKHPPSAWHILNASLIVSAENCQTLPGIWTRKHFHTLQFCYFSKQAKNLVLLSLYPWHTRFGSGKTKLLLKIFVLAKIISKLSNTSIAETMNTYYMYILKMFIPNLRFASLSSKKLMSTWQLRSGSEISRTTQFIRLTDHANTGDILIVNQSQANTGGRGLKALPAQQKGIPEGNAASSGTCCRCLLMGCRFPCPWSTKHGGHTSRNLS